ncbi:MAG: glycosyltransferase [Candidatus Brocadia sp.]|uniref:Glycosyl transferase family 2 n=1 Tax=Candidatus Brocadia fulgida TaxID=380242 RepID=A0A0M2UR59_9BACT|nr:MAG: Glycosyl transferase family 2 [Candidatus Brocadia fulgida]UJS20219.1 MAG: glycosyltransferase [Candidatus Brocadia sp.]
MSKSNLIVELVIPSYNRLNTLQDTLKQIRVLYPTLKVCVGLQGNVSDQDFQAQLKSDPYLRIEVLPHPSTTGTLNHCITSSQADIIVILDDDAVPCFGWLEAHIRAFDEQPDLVYTSGREVRLTKGRSAFSEWFRIMTEWFFGLFVGSDKKLNGRIVGWANKFGVILGNFNQPGICKINSPRGCNMAVRRESFLKIGGFHSGFTGNAYYFEADFGLRLAKEGYYGQYRGDAIVIHQEVPSGGSREAKRGQWFKDSLYNHKLLIHTLGPQAWIGSLPRLVKGFLTHR